MIRHSKLLKILYLLVYTISMTIIYKRLLIINWILIWLSLVDKFFFLIQSICKKIYRLNHIKKFLFHHIFKILTMKELLLNACKLNWKLFVILIFWEINLFHGSIPIFCWLNSFVNIILLLWNIFNLKFVDWYTPSLQTILISCENL